MDIQKKCIQYNDQLFKELESRFKYLVKGIEPELLHDFRLSIKKLRAFVEGSHLVLDNPESKNSYKRILQLFKLLGVIREMQINRSLYVSNDPDLPDSLLNFVDSQERKAQTAFLKYLKKMHTHQLKILGLGCSYYLESCDSQKLLNALYEGLEKNFKILFDHVRKKNWKKQLHPIRIRIRHLWELMQILKMFDQSESLLAFTDHLKSLNRKLGDWHDLEVAWLDGTVFCKKYPDQKTALKKLMDTLRFKKEALEREISEILLHTGAAFSQSTTQNGLESIAK